MRLDSLDDEIFKISNNQDFYNTIVSNTNVSNNYLYNNYVDVIVHKKTDDILDELPIDEIENYLRRKKIKKINEKIRNNSK